jgi:hypothetical protein
VHSDHLGTPRAKSDEGTNVVAGSRAWFHPYGERGAASSDPVKYKFTGKERDPESDLDYFMARYYSSAQGGSRFTECLKKRRCLLERRQTSIREGKVP